MIPTILEIVKADITTMQVDAIVNAANTSLFGGGGVDGAIHRAGGKAILEECKKIIAIQNGCEVGEAVITTAGNMPSTFVIHTVGPIWHGGFNNERELLANCYKNSLHLALINKCKSIAFPSISTGVYRFPKSDAAAIALQSVKDFIAEHDSFEKIIFVCFDDENYNELSALLKN